VTEALFTAVSRLMDLPDQVPGGGLTFAGLGLAVGLSLWLVGQRFIRTATVLASAGVYALAAYLLVPASPLGASLGPVQAAGLGAIVGAVLGLIVVRPVVAAGSALGLAVLALIGAGAVLNARPVDGVAGSPGPLARVSVVGPTALAQVRYVDVDRAVDELARRALQEVDLRALQAALGDSGAAGQTPTEEGAVATGGAEASPAAERVRGVMERWGTWAREQWAEVPAAHQRVLVLAGAVGAAVGLALGVAWPRKAGGLVTGLVGAALWVPAAVWMVVAIGGSLPTALELEWQGWAGVWATAGLAGAGVQWSGLLGGKRKGRVRAVCPS
jgi:hypothetical protein